MTSIFLSYARGDDERFVARLHGDLTRAGFSVWWDRVSMPSRALTFLQEVRDAITDRDRFVIVVGPAAVRSDYVRTEWQWALNICKPVTPLLRSGGYDILPEELRRWHAPDFRSDSVYAVEFDRLQNQLRAAVAPSGPLVGVPEVPPHFLQRPAEVRAIEQAVLGDTVKPVAVTGSAQRVGLQGMGGIGKSVLAATCARTCEVRRVFPDGIFWITVGQTPLVTLRQAQLAEALGDGPRAFDDVEQGKARLSMLLAGKRCLIILDDVWQTHHAAAFDALGAACRLLITTRDHGISTSLGATECRLDVLSDDESLQLLAEWAGETIGTLPAEAHEVVRECGRLPLALAIVGAMVRDSAYGWNSALHKLRSADLEKLRRDFPSYPYPDLLRAIRVGVDALWVEVQARYFDFGVFPEDTAIPEAVLQTFWRPLDYDVHATHDLLDLLANKSLMRRDTEGRLTLHDLQFDYVRTQCGDRSALHNRLVDAYASVCQDGWHSGPDDGYFFAHLGHHLVEAGRKEDLRNLLLDFRWLRAKLEATNVAALLADFEPFADEAVARAVASAIRLASHVVAISKSELSAQLIARLSWHEHPQIVALLRQAEEWSGATWLLPLRASLPPATGPLVRTIAAEVGVFVLAGLPDGFRIFTGGTQVWDARSGDVVMTTPALWPHFAFAAMTGDGRVLRVNGNALQLCDLATGNEIDSVGVRRGWELHVTAVGEHAVFTWDDKDSVDVGFWNFRTGDSDLSSAAPAKLDDMAALDERRVLTVHADASLLIWDAGRGTIERRFRNPGEAACHLAVTRDGRFTAVASAKDVHFVDLERDESLWIANVISPAERMSGGSVGSVAITHDSRFVICGSHVSVFSTGGGFIAILEAATGKEVRRFAAHSDSVTSLLPLPDGRFASGSSDHTIKVWDPESESAFITAPAHDSAIGGVTVSTDGRYAISGSYDRSLKVWDLATGSAIRTLKEHVSGINAVAALPGGKAITASHDKTLKVWDCDRGIALQTLQGHSHDVKAVAATRDGSRAVSVSYDGTLRVWELHDGTAGLTESGVRGWSMSAAITPNGRYAVAGQAGYTELGIRIFDLQTGTQWALDSKAAGHVNGVAVFDDHVVFVAPDEGEIRLIDLDTHEIVRRIPTNVGGLSSIAVTANGRRVAVTSWSGIVQLWDAERWDLVASFHTDGLLTCCAISPVGSHIVAGDRSGQMHLLRVRDIDEQQHRR